MKGVLSLEEIIDIIPDGARMFIGGYMGEQNAQRIIKGLLDSDKGNFTVICNDGGQKNGPKGIQYYGIASLIHAGKVKKLIATHVGLNPEVSELANAGKMELSLIPQGTLAEVIRAGGAGLGGVLTPTGVGTEVENSEFCLGKQQIHGKDYLLMDSMKADIAILCAYQADTAGNLWYKGTSRTFSTVMATAADLVIVEPHHIVPVGTIAHENIHTSGIFVDYLLEGGSVL